MKKNILFLIVLVCVLMNHKVIAQSNAQITTEELKNLYENGEYAKAISYIEQFKNMNDGYALVILGDCYWKKSYIEEEQSIKTFNQLLINQSMAISQGLYFDNSFQFNLQQQIQQGIIQ